MGLLLDQVRLNSTEVLGNTKSKSAGLELCDETDGFTITAGSDENSAEDGDGGEGVECGDEGSCWSESDSGTGGLLR